MDYFLSPPAIVRVFVVFSLIVFLNSKGLHLGLSALAGAVFIGFWNGTSPLELTHRLAEAAFAPDTLLLSLLLSSILFLSSIMKSTGRLDRIVSAYRLLVRSPRIAIATLPTVIGVLPVPGGAVFSAPMVSAIDANGELNPTTRAVANYWFRHMIELVWPLYPAFILTSSLTGLSIPALCATNAYSPFVLIIAGFAFLLPRSYGKKQGEKVIGFGSAFFGFIRAFAPVIIVIICAMFFDGIWPILQKSLTLFPTNVLTAMRHYLPAFIGVSFAIIFLKAMNPSIHIRPLFPLKASLLLIGTVAGITIFSRILGSLGIAAAAGKELSALGVAPAIVVAALPFVTALVTGVGFGYVGLSFPLILALIPSGSTPIHYAAYVAMASAFGFAGMMLSPLHVCMVVSAEHFKVRSVDMLRRLAAPVAVYLSVAICYFLLLSYL